jgi:hypothetical protein
MESVLTTTRIKTSRLIYRIEAGILFVGGLLAAVNVNSLLKLVIGSHTFAAFGQTRSGVEAFEILHPVIQILFLILAILGASIFYLAQAAIDPGLKRISFVYIFFYLTINLILIHGLRLAHEQHTPEVFFIVLFVLFLLFFLFHTVEILAIVKRRVMRKIAKKSK